MFTIDRPRRWCIALPSITVILARYDEVIRKGGEAVGTYRRAGGYPSCFHIHRRGWDQFRGPLAGSLGVGLVIGVLADTPILGGD